MAEIDRHKVATRLLKISTLAVTPAEFKQDMWGGTCGINIHVIHIGNYAIILSHYDADEDCADETPEVESVTTVENAIRDAVECYNNYYDDPPGKQVIDSASELPDHTKKVGRILNSLYSPPDGLPPTAPSGILHRIVAASEINNLPDWMWAGGKLYLTSGKLQPEGTTSTQLIFDDALCDVFRAVKIHCEGLQLPVDRENRTQTELIQGAAKTKQIEKLEHNHQKLRNEIGQLDEKKKPLLKRIREIKNEIALIKAERT